MKRVLYLIALILAVFTAIAYVVGTGWEDEEVKVKAEMSLSKKLKMWKVKAKKGDPESQYNLGAYYETQRKDYLNAQKWYRVAATKGRHAGSQYKLAQLYMNGRGVENNLPMTMKWFRLSAAQGDARGQYFLGVAQRDGWERKNDYIEAYKWFWLANKNAELVRSEDPRFDPEDALAELDAVMSQFNRDQGIKRAKKWRPKLK